MSPIGKAKQRLSRERERAHAQGGRDVEDRLAQIGLSPQTGWYTAIVLYAAGGIPVIIAHLIDPETYNYTLFVLGMFAVAISLGSVIGLRYFPSSRKGTHVRLITGATLIVIGGFTIGEVRQSFALLALVVSMPPAIYYGTRDTIPYLLGATVFALAVSWNIDQTWARGMGVLSALTIFTLTISMLVAQARTRRYARSNRELAYTDALTGLANTRALRNAIELELQREDGEAPALFAIDLDNFKLVNDTFDHARGDAVLKAVAEEISAEGRPGDVFARRGGDEFSLLVADPGDRDLGDLSKRIAKAIGVARERVCPEISPSGSVAYVRAKRNDSVPTLLRRADDRLHDAKVKFHEADDAPRAVRLAVIDRRSESDRAREERFDDQLRRSTDYDVAPQGELLRGSVAIDRPIWIFNAVLNALIGTAIAFVAVLGWTEPFGALEGLAAAGVFWLLATGSLAAGMRPLPASFVHVSFALGLVALGATVMYAGSAGAALIDLFGIAAIFAFHFFRVRPALVWLVLSLSAFAYLGIAGGFPYVGMHIAVFTTMMFSTAGIAAKVRQVTSRFIAENWQLSQTDSLTSLSNVRALRARLDETVATAESGGLRPAILAVDLDDFKTVNDSFSHTVGDQVLRAVSRAIAENVRVDDMVSRRGGDEFAVVTEIECDKELAQVAERVRESIIEARRRICPQILPTASVATVRWREGDDADEFMRRADVALHECKVEVKSRQTA